MQSLMGAYAMLDQLERHEMEESRIVQSLGIFVGVGKGYLTNVAPSEFQQFYEERVPASLKGSAFLVTFGSHVDLATEVQEDADYPVRQATLHPIHENFRVQSFRQALLSDDANRASIMGELMFQVGRTFQACNHASHISARPVAASIAQ